jgi:transcriptional regulator with XRE-family HTH domain
MIFFDENGAFTPKGLADARRSASLTQAELAVRIGRNPLTVSRWERGINPVPKTLYPLLPMVLDVSWPPERVEVNA